MLCCLNCCWTNLKIDFQGYIAQHEYRKITVYKIFVISTEIKILGLICVKRMLEIV